MFSPTNTKEFKAGNFVFAKVKGFPFWPAKILNVDNTSFKTIVKYEVLFFGSNETTFVNKNDLLHYYENKFRYPLESVAQKHKNNYSVALKEIAKAWEAENKTNNGSPSTPSMKSAKTPSQRLHHNSASRSDRNQKVEVHTLSSKIDTVNVEEVSVNPPTDKSDVQKLSVLTEKCITLEKALIEERKHKTDDFHTQILKQELNKLKEELKSLQRIIDILQEEKNELTTQIGKMTQQTPSNLNNSLNTCKITQESQTCVTTTKSNSWITISQKGKLNKAKESNQITEVTLQNSFEALTSTDSETYQLDSTGIPTEKSTNKPNPSQPSKKKCITTKGQAKKIKAANQTSRLAIISDSQGRGLVHCIDLVAQGKFDTFGCTMPGAHLEDVLSSSLNADILKNYKETDWILLMAGCNNVKAHHSIDDKAAISNKIINCLTSLIEKCKNTNLILTTLPYRYDLHNSHYHHQIIAEINNNIRALVYKNKDVNLLDLYLLEKFNHTRHGYHINKNGKRKVANMILDIIQTKCQATQTENDPTAIKHITQTVNLGCGKNITITQQDMTRVINDHCNNKEVAFSHTISGDFGNDRHMTAGVAVTFAREFGKPTLWNCVSDHLAYQQVKDGAGVYSLITKLDYWGKPNLNDYDKAFGQFCNDFKRKGYKYLYCSPMGCIRDRVKVEHFIKNVIKFQVETKAQIKIVAYNQRSARVLRNGLDHNTFIKEMERCLETFSYLQREEDPLTPIAPGEQTYADVVSRSSPVSPHHPPLINPVSREQMPTSDVPLRLSMSTTTDHGSLHLPVTPESDRSFGVISGEKSQSSVIVSGNEDDRATKGKDSSLSHSFLEKRSQVNIIV
ncbi:uncharacterized protein LOC128990770 [Macrosteles quadrilineatus]|uniref:uncharacterized protein LOC128990770 n=1 Tax=Macrosteles quadrilineatus TaxID=74068 RepID=UPI0023E0F9EF|nr:uncharacterized protein LOC128990770 [Macrosteles quadrilineatus]